MKDTNKKNIAQSECKFIVTETIQGMIHKFCQNSKMLEINKCQPDGKLVCMGIKCGNAFFDTSENA